MGNQFPYAPIKTGIHPADPSFRHLNLGNLNDHKSPVHNNFDDGFKDGNYKIKIQFENFVWLPFFLF